MTLSHEEPFDIRLTLDLSELEVPESAPLHYKASLYSKGLGSSGHIVGETEGTLIAAHTVAITVERNTLTNGIYRLAATVILGRPSMKLTLAPGTMAVIDGGQVQVF